MLKSKLWHWSVTARGSGPRASLAQILSLWVPDTTGVVLWELQKALALFGMIWH